MKILQIGAPRSGNLWLWRILQQVIDRAGLPNDSVVRSHPVHDLLEPVELSHDRQSDIDMLDIQAPQNFWRVSSVWRMPIDDMEDYVDRADHVLTHSHFCEASPEVFRHFDRLVYICRDPRDRALSSARFAFTPYMQRYFPHDEPSPEEWLEHRFEDRVHDWMWHVYEHLRFRRRFDIHFVFYEQLLHDFDITLDSLLAYLQVELPSPEREAIRRAVTFEKMNAENPEHVREGRAERWRRQMTGERVRRCREIAGPLLELLGYALGPVDPPIDDRPPSVPSGPAQRQLEQRLVG